MIFRGAGVAQLGEDPFTFLTSSPVPGWHRAFAIFHPRRDSGSHRFKFRKEFTRDVSPRTISKNSQQGLKNCRGFGAMGQTRESFYGAQ